MANGEKRFYYSTHSTSEGGGANNVLHIGGVFQWKESEDAQKTSAENIKAEIFSLWNKIQDNLDIEFEIKLYVEVNRDEALISFLPIVSTLPKRYYEEHREIGSENVLIREITREEYLEGKKKGGEMKYRSSYVLEKKSLRAGIQQAMFKLIDAILLTYSS